MAVTDQRVAGRARRRRAPDHRGAAQARQATSERRVPGRCRRVLRPSEPSPQLDPQLGRARDQRPGVRRQRERGGACRRLQLRRRPGVEGEPGDRAHRREVPHEPDGPWRGRRHGRAAQTAAEAITAITANTPTGLTASASAAAAIAIPRHSPAASTRQATTNSSTIAGITSASGLTELAIVATVGVPARASQIATACRRVSGADRSTPRRRARPASRTAPTRSDRRSRWSAAPGRTGG